MSVKAPPAELPARQRVEADEFLVAVGVQPTTFEEGVDQISSRSGSKTLAVLSSRRADRAPISVPGR
jgi:hypothetical protein